MSSKTEGKIMRDAGYVPHYPIIIVPGLASSGLVLEAGYQRWLFERVWLSIAKLGFSMVNKHRKKEIHVTVDPNDTKPGIFRTRVLHKRTDKTKKWEKRLFWVNQETQMMYWFAGESDMALGKALGSCKLDDQSHIEAAPADKDRKGFAGFTILLATTHKAMLLSCSCKEEFDTVMQEFTALFAHFGQKKAYFRNKYQRYVNFDKDDEHQQLVADMLINQLGELEITDEEGDQDEEDRKESGEIEPYSSSSSSSSSSSPSSSPYSTAPASTASPVEGSPALGRQKTASSVVATAYLKKGSSSSRIVRSINRRDDKQEQALRNFWVRHITLAPDGISDPPSIRARPVAGVEAIAYLEVESQLAKEPSYVFGPLLYNLVEAGYQPEYNLLAMPYDWRIPPFYLEARDGYFSLFKQTIEETHERTGQKVVLLAHSMGNRVVHYLLNWINQFPGGRQWISDHVHSWFAVGPPFLGAPKAIRGVVSGDKLGLDTFLSDDEGLMFARSSASTPWLFPNSKLFFQTPSTEFIKRRKEAPGPPEYEDVSVPEILKDAGAERVWKWYEDYYVRDFLYGGLPSQETILQAPPLDRLYNVYSINFPTEVYTYVKKDKETSLSPFVPDPEAPSLDPHYKVEGGIAYETSATPQAINQLIGGVARNVSGDGTVPYASLAYSALWNGVNGLQVRHCELLKGKHREILDQREFFSTVLKYLMLDPTGRAGGDVVFERSSVF